MAQIDVTVIPTQLLLYLGAQVHLVKGRSVPSQQRRGNLIACVHMLRDACSHSTSGSMVMVLGLMASIDDLVPVCRLHMRHTDSPSSSLKPLTDPLSKLVPRTDIISAELSWWDNPINLSVGMEFPIPPYTYVVTMDRQVGRPFEGSSSVRRMDAFRNMITHKSSETLGSHEDSPGVQERFDQSTCSSAIG
jgi:hypothetical protein